MLDENRAENVAADGTDATDLTAEQLGQIAFYSDSGTTFLGWAGYANDLDGEVVPVPEPSSWVATALALGALGFTQLRRMRKAFLPKAIPSH